MSRGLGVLKMLRFSANWALEKKKKEESCSCRKKVYTICDFYDFGLIFAGQMHCLPQRLKSTLFEIFSNRGCPKGTQSIEKISNNIDFSL